VKAFQRDRGLHVDGVVGRQVRAALAGTAGSTQFGRVA
jgi:murein L,D-transpeptidase YcbB/YkuD